MVKVILEVVLEMLVQVILQMQDLEVVVLELQEEMHFHLHQV